MSPTEKIPIGPSQEQMTRLIGSGSNHSSFDQRRVVSSWPLWNPFSWNAAVPPIEQWHPVGIQERERKGFAEQRYFSVANDDPPFRDFCFSRPLKSCCNANVTGTGTLEGLPTTKHVRDPPNSTSFIDSRRPLHLVSTLTHEREGRRRGRVIRRSRAYRSYRIQLWESNVCCPPRAGESGVFVSPTSFVAFLNPEVGPIRNLV